MSWYKPWTWGDESESAQQKRTDLNNQGGMSSWFADQAQGGFQQLGAEAQQQRDYLRQLASGQHSVSAEQLRQGLNQNLGTQRSLAASASPQNSAMAALQAARQSASMGTGLAGQQALAGLQERNQAQQMLAQMIMQQRGQDLQAALGARGQAINAYGGVTPDKSFLDKWGGAIAGGAALAAGK